MGIVKVMRRRDGWSVVIAIVTAMIITTPIAIMVGPLTGKIVNSHNGPYSYGNMGWKDGYLAPLVYAVLQLVALEILIWACMLLGMFGTRATTSLRKAKK